MQIKMKFMVFLLVLMATRVAYGQNSAYIYQDSLYKQLNGYSAKKLAIDSLTKVYSDEIKAEQNKLMQKFNQLPGLIK
jgi:hypothetical protein